MDTPKIAEMPSNSPSPSAPTPIPTVNEQTTPDYAMLARMHIRECKPFYTSALAAGYAESVARRGLKAILADSKPLADAIRKESEAFHIGLDKLKPLAINRLYVEITDMNSTNGMRAIELAGRFKETDWFVRNSETNLGIFMAFTEAPQAEQKTIDVYQE